MKLLQTILNSVLILSLSTTMAMADLYKTGSKITAFKANDQHGQAYEFEAAKTKYLLVSFDMETGKKANAALSAQGADFLNAGHRTDVCPAQDAQVPAPHHPRR
jgi:hypothetical protein